jgi:Xaa-Pro aminopeptidase
MGPPPAISTRGAAAIMRSVDHAARRQRLSERFDELGVEAVLVTRIVNVRYLTGFTGTNGQIVVTREGGTFFTDSRYQEQSRREVPELPTEIYDREFHRRVGEVCRAGGLRRLGFEATGLTYRGWRRLEAEDGVVLLAVEDAVERFRWVKDPDELRLIERAQGITDEAFDRVTGKLVEGITERQVAFELELAMRQLGAERIAFDSIVAFGEQAAEPHHRPADRPLRRGDVVKLDFGAIVDGYHSDMTRTVAFGEPDHRIREVHQVVLRAHLAGVEAVRAGASGGEADGAARGVVQEAGFGDRFGHGLGHGVGLEIHEGPSLRREGEDVLPAGAVVTVEPGVYLPGVGGVRIEDLVVVEPDGCRPLPEAPKELVVL